VSIKVHIFISHLFVCDHLARKIDSILFTVQKRVQKRVGIQTEAPSAKETETKKEIPFMGGWGNDVGMK
jgi:hypothetical protein